MLTGDLTAGGGDDSLLSFLILISLHIGRRRRPARCLAEEHLALKPFLPQLFSLKFALLVNAALTTPLLLPFPCLLGTTKLQTGPFPSPPLRTIRPSPSIKSRTTTVSSCEYFFLVAFAPILLEEGLKRGESERELLPCQRDRENRLPPACRGRRLAPSASFSPVDTEAPQRRSQQESEGVETEASATRQDERIKREKKERRTFYRRRRARDLLVP